MKITVLTAFTFLVFSKTFAQYCNTAGPSSNADSNVKTVQLTGSSGAINYTGCPGVIGLEDLTGSTSVTLAAGQNYNAIVEFGTCGGNYFGAGQAWIDFNGDFNFDPSESIGTWTGTPPAAPLGFNFTVPAMSLTGATRMRVVQHEAGSLPLNPCEAFTWGSAVDFTVIISGGVDCSGYHGDTKEDAIAVNSLPFSTTGNTSYCYFNQNLVYSSPDMYYLLKPTPAMGPIHISLCGSTFDTFLSVVDPQGNVLAYNDDGSCGSSSECDVNAEWSDSMYVIVEGWGNNSGAFTLNIVSELSVTELGTPTLNVFPNPASNFFKISNSTGTLNILNLQGQLIRSQQVEKDEQISIEDLPAGIYVLELISDQVSGTTKLIKK